MTRSDHPLLDSLRSGRLSRRDFLHLILAVLVGAAATLTGFLYFRATEKQRLASDFQTMAEGRAQSLRVELAKHETVLRLLGGFFEASGETVAGDYGLFAAEFREFSHGVLDQEKHLQAVAIISRLPDAERQRFEQAAGAPAGFRLTEVGENGGIRPAARRSQYYPVLVAEPHPPNTLIPGWTWPPLPACGRPCGGRPARRPRPRKARQPPGCLPQPFPQANPGQGSFCGPGRLAS